MRLLVISLCCAALGGLLPAAGSATTPAAPVATLIALAGLRAPAAPAPAPSATRRPATVRLAACRFSGGADGRSATFVARMRAVAGTERMSMRFTLLEQLGRGAPAALDVPALDDWRTSDRGVARLGYRQRIRGLVPGAAYRVAVDFRWLDATGSAIKSAVRQSRLCRQPGKPPNLRLGTLKMLPGPDPGSALYEVPVVNAGSMRLWDIRLTVTVDGVALPPVQVAALGPGDRRSIRVLGPLCRREAQAAAYPASRVRESTRSDNVRVRDCLTAGA